MECDASPIGVLDVDINEVLTNYIENAQDTEEKRKLQLNYIYFFGGADGQDFKVEIESILGTPPGFSDDEKKAVNQVVNNYYLNLKGQYFFAVFLPVLDAAKPFIELALIESGTGVLFQALKAVLNTRWGIQVVRIGTNLTKSLEEIILGIKSELNISADLRSMQISVGNKTLTGTSNPAKSTYNFTGATEAEAKAFFDKLTEGAKRTKMDIPAKGEVIRVDLGNNQFILMRNFATSGGDLTIQIHKALINGKLKEIKFFF